ncbi:MAG: GNAT family N-acetyltransferase [candidate division WOR-3 bacterium]|nr:MAG: GNAT family N-acetyltransferase [candidate division WOR-3 bacterium]
MTVRTISAQELDSFAAPYASEWVKEMLSKFWQEGRSSPEQCFLAEDEQGIVGRVAYWSQASAPADLFVFGLHLPWKADYVEVGKELFRASLELMSGRGARSVTLYFHAEFDGHVEQRHRLMQELGFEQSQDKVRYLWTGDTLPQVADRLAYRTMPELGEEAFQDAVQRVTAGTLDREDQGRVKRLGPEAAAREYMQLLEDADDPRHDWWLLGFEPDGTLVGLVVPQPLDEQECGIGYVGVVPEKRGQGYSLDLLVKGTAVAHSHGFRKSVAEVDRLNAPMRAALERAGYKETGQLWAYRLNL